MALKNQQGNGYAVVQTTGSDEIAEILKELVVEISKPGHDLQPKNLQWAYGTSVQNRRERTFAEVDAGGNARPAVVIEIKTPNLAQRIYQGTMRLATDAEIKSHLDAQEAMREKINRMEVERKRNEVAV